MTAAASELPPPQRGDLMVRPCRGHFHGAVLGGWDDDEDGYDSTDIAWQGMTFAAANEWFVRQIGGTR